MILSVCAALITIDDNSCYFIVNIFQRGGRSKLVLYWWYCCYRKSRAAYAQSFALWQQATIEFTCHDHSPRTLVITFNRSHVSIVRASTPRSLIYCLFAPHLCMVLFFTHIPFVVNHTINATPPEGLQQYAALFC